MATFRWLFFWTVQSLLVVHCCLKRWLFLDILQKLMSDPSTFLVAVPRFYGAKDVNFLFSSTSSIYVLVWSNWTSKKSIADNFPQMKLIQGKIQVLASLKMKDWRHVMRILVNLCAGCCTRLVSSPLWLYFLNSDRTFARKF